MPSNRIQRRAAAEASKKVKEDDNDGDSEWEQSSQQESSVDDESLQNDTEESSQAEEEEPKKMPAKKKAPTKKRKAPPVYESGDSDAEDLIPTYARKTAKGGYAHTNRSRARISKANKGNTPWNKGKNRSEGVKAKIAAGVRARNRAVLLEKLRKLGMSEEEWLQKKKEIKYLRERVRKARVASENRETKKRKGKNAVCIMMLLLMIFLLLCSDWVIHN